MTSAIPVVDLSGALEPAGPRSAEVALALRAAGTASGFFYVAHHGVPVETVDAQFALARRFFDLPLATKQALDMRKVPQRRGYESVGAQQLDAAARPDLKESFYCGIEHGPEHRYVRRGYQGYGANQWPAELPEMAGTCLAYIASMRRLAERLMQLIALSLELPEGWFDGTHADPMATLRLLRYPPHPADADAATFGAGAHTDWGAITILAQDAHGGLEVRMPDGRWTAATPLAGTFVVNLGDMIPRWTNGRYHSNPHRVRNTASGGAPRHSIPFFYNPDHDAVITPVPTCVPVGETPRYAPCTAGEHLRERYQTTYGLATVGAAMA